MLGQLFALHQLPMRQITLALICISCAGQRQRAQPSAEQQQRSLVPRSQGLLKAARGSAEGAYDPLRALAMLLLVRSRVAAFCHPAPRARPHLLHAFHGSQAAHVAMAMIEVEKKFEPPDLTVLAERVTVGGGERIGEKRFTDIYYDTSDCVLTRSDIWLRSRDGEWELKLPVAEDARRSGGERTVFREVSGAAAVCDSLRELLPDVSGIASDTPIAALLDAAQATPFAEFSTVRSKWKLGNASIDADMASFGHGVLEIEVMVATPEEVPSAEAEIARVAEVLAAKPLVNAMGGKLETYIRRHCPSVLAQLVEAGILQEG